MQRLDTSQTNFDSALAQLTAWQDELDERVSQAVAAIVEDVAARGDAAVLASPARFYPLKAGSLAELEVSPQ